MEANFKFTSMQNLLVFKNMPRVNYARRKLRAVMEVVVAVECLLCTYYSIVSPPAGVLCLTLLVVNFDVAGEFHACSGSFSLLLRQRRCCFALFSKTPHAGRSERICSLKG